MTQLQPLLLTPSAPKPQTQKPPLWASEGLLSAPAAAMKSQNRTAPGGQRGSRSKQWVCLWGHPVTRTTPGRFPEKTNRTPFNRQHHRSCPRPLTHGGRRRLFPQALSQQLLPPRLLGSRSSRAACHAVPSWSPSVLQSAASLAESLRLSSTGPGSRLLFKTY